MDLSDRDLALVAVLADGLPLTERPFADLGAPIAMPEDEVIARIAAMTAAGVIRRFGVIVRHRELGYSANAMAVWSIPDEQVAAVGALLADCPEVTLCYRRPRRLPDWPYNLFCMVHGRDRPFVETIIKQLSLQHGLGGFQHAVLFSSKRFKQRGAVYGKVA
jgi:DNA-binding Lrp family transcriptional regulator